jgi:hypothetical protein
MLLECCRIELDGLGGVFGYASLATDLARHAGSTTPLLTGFAN